MATIENYNVYLQVVAVAAYKKDLALILAKQ